MPYRLYLYILTQLVSTGKAEAFFGGRNIQITLDAKGEKWLISSPVCVRKNQNIERIKEFFPRQCKARFTSTSSYLVLENAKTLSLKKEIFPARRYLFFREAVASYLQEAEDWSTIFS